jgi:hypothetical protein
MGPNATLNAVKKIKVQPYVRNVTPNSQLPPVALVTVLTVPISPSTLHWTVKKKSVLWKETNFFYIQSHYSVGTYRIALHFEQRYTNREWQFGHAAKFCTVAPSICGPQCGTFFMSPFWRPEFCICS